MLKFLHGYLRSMRLYYGFVTGTTTLVGCLTSGHALAEGRTWLLFAMGFLAWGFNQIFSDWCDRTEDAINAPHRPMVTGELKPLPAFAVSAAGLAAIAIAGYVMSPWTLAFLALGGVLNIAYSFLKRVPVVNCLVYACAISCCALFAIAGMAKRCPTLDEFEFIAAWIVPVHFLMCHNSYYKDVKGDRAAGVRTLQTMCPSVALALSDSMAILAVVLSGFTAILNVRFLAFAVLAAVLAIAFHLAVSRSRFHRATCLNCQLCVLLLHFHFFKASWPYAIVSLAAIQLLFLWYDDEKE